MPARSRTHAISLLATLAISLLATLAIPAARAGAGTSIYSRVLHVYERSGSIPACKFTSRQLAAARTGVDTYGAQYFADFTAAIDAALGARAAGACLPHGSVVPEATQQLPSAAVPPAPVTGATHAGLPAAILLMAVLAALVILVALVAALARVRGWDPAWAAAWRHAWSEAGYRAGGTWAEFVDWLRTGP